MDHRHVRAGEHHDLGERPAGTDQRRRLGHVAADGDGPDRQLIPRQQVAGEAQQHRQHQQDDADDPVELARRLVGAGQEDAHHVQPDRDDHRVGAPAVNLAQDAQRHVGTQVLDVLVGVFDRRPVVEHQQHAADDLGQEQEERQPAHAPGEAEADAALADGDWVQVQEDVGHDRHHARAAIARHAVAEDRVPDLRVADVIRAARR